VRRFAIVLLATAVSLAPAGRAYAQLDADEGWDDKAVERAIDRARAFLWSKWSGGHWPERGKRGAQRGGAYVPNYGGVTALCAYALLAAGVRPQETRMKQTLQWLAAVQPLHGTYARALRANVWSMLGGKSPYRRNLMQDVKWLLNAMDGRGAYNYFPGPKVAASVEDAGAWRGLRYDNSNSQLAVLGVWAGARRELEVPAWYWRRVERHWTADQNVDGGWGYQSGRNSYGSMSVAGLATMFICFDNIYYKDFIKCKADTSYPPIVKGLKWLDKNFSADRNPGRGESYYYYYLYGVERVGLASGYKYFGKKDWYKLGTAALLARQHGSGGWGSLEDTAFALLFLARGRHPVLFNKLQYSGTWNCRPRDLANLTRWVSRTFETQVNWQIIHLGVPVSEWHDAPILYISGATAPKFSDADLDKMRRFVHQGGMIFSEAAGNRTTFTLAMRKYYARLFPEYEITRLDGGHPLFSRELQFPIADARGLSGISNGVRLLAVHAPAEVSLAWQLNSYAMQEDVFRLAANIYFYVTGKGILPPRGVNRWTKKKRFSSVDSLRVARIKYAGNWDPEPLAWERFSILMGAAHRVAVDVKAMEVAELDAAEWPVAEMTGTSSFQFTDEQRQALAKYLAAGGTLLLDAAGGSPAFGEAADKQARDLLPGGEYGLLPLSHALYTKTAPGAEKVDYRKTTSSSVFAPHAPRLRGLTVKGRLAVIVSKDDLTAGLVGYPCWSVKGYSPESAFALVRNIILHASGKTLPATPPAFSR